MPSPTPAPPPPRTPTQSAWAFEIDWSSQEFANQLAIGSLVVALIGIAVSLILVMVQIRKQWLLSSSEVVTDFEKRFVSDEWKAYRASCARKLRRHWQGASLSLSQDFEVLGMFEHLALMVKRRMVDFETVWSKFGWYYIRYFEGLTGGPVDAIQTIRDEEGDQTLWEEFEWFYERCRREYARRGVSIDPSGAPERVSQLIAQEETLSHSAAGFWARIRRMLP